MEPELTDDQRAALTDLGVTGDRAAAFLRGEAVAVPLECESSTGIAILQRLTGRLRGGVVEINDPGGGIKTLARFRGRCQVLAARLGLSELELFGVAVINPKLRGL